MVSDGRERGNSAASGPKLLGKVVIRSCSDQRIYFIAREAGCGRDKKNISGEQLPVPSIGLALGLPRTLHKQQH